MLVHAARRSWCELWNIVTRDNALTCGNCEHRPDSSSQLNYLVWTDGGCLQTVPTTHHAPARTDAHADGRGLPRQPSSESALTRASRATCVNRWARPSPVRSSPAADTGSVCMSQRTRYRLAQRVKSMRRLLTRPGPTPSEPASRFTIRPQRPGAVQDNPGRLPRSKVQKPCVWWNHTTNRGVRPQHSSSS